METVMKPDAETARPSLLIVDDYPGNLDILCLALAEFYSIRTALSGEEALSLLLRSTYQPDLILLDVMMPDLDGYEVCRRLKKDSRFRDVPVIFVSAIADVESKVVGLESGGVDYVTKPYSFLEIRARIETHLKLSRLARMVEASNRELEARVEQKIADAYQAQLEIIFALSNLVSLRDPAAEGHNERVRRVCEILGKALLESPAYRDQIDSRAAETIALASPLHDIGKISIPDRILSHSGPLSPEDQTLLEMHTAIGAAALTEVRDYFPGNQFIETGIVMARSHHERWDGTGYPDGLAGPAIPLAAQVMALANVLDYRCQAARGTFPDRFVFQDPFLQQTAGRTPTFAEVRLSIYAEAGSGFAPELVHVYGAAAAAIETIYQPGPPGETCHIKD
jgi:putative two-component system response regulator